MPSVWALFEGGFWGGFRGVFQGFLGVFAQYQLLG